MLTALPDLGKWLEDVGPEIAVVQAMLRAPLSDNPRSLVEQLTEAESWYGRVMTLLADANSYLDLAEQEQLGLIDKSLTVLERQTALAAAVFQERRLRDILEGLAEALKNRTMLGMNLRRQAVGERTEF